MRILGIETSSARGSVTLLEDGEDVCSLEHRRENAHGESILPLIEQALAQAGWNRRQLDRIAVGIGPGSFTGLRVGIAIAQGLAEGLEIPLVGVPSLRAMALAVPRDQPGCRCVLVDARKGEAFLAAYDEHGSEALAVQLVPDRVALLDRVRVLRDPIYLGNAAALFPELERVYRSADTDFPHARWTALMAADSLVTPLPVLPLYVRDDVAVIPRLPGNPLAPGNAS